LLKSFELPEKVAKDLTDREKEVLGNVIQLAEGICAEEEATQKGWEGDVEGDKLDNGDSEEWIDKVMLTPEEEELAEKVVPITHVLIKVCDGDVPHFLS